MYEQTGTSVVPAHKNVLLLIVDDLGKNLGCYGAEVNTSNVNAFASEGFSLPMHSPLPHLVATAALSSTPVYILTKVDNMDWQEKLITSSFSTTSKPSPPFFGEQGYLTGFIGKVHVGPDYSYPWHIRKECTTRDVAWVADQAAEVFGTAKTSKQPVFLTVGYIDPHRDMTRSAIGNKDAFDARIKDVPYQPSSIKVPTFINNIDESRFEFPEYYRSISRLDQGIGMMLEKLKASGLADDTFAVFPQRQWTAIPEFENNSFTMKASSCHS